MKRSCNQCGHPHPKCNGHNRDGNPCGIWAITGGQVCWRHGGRTKRTAARANVRAELQAWGLTDETVDPAEQLLRMVTQSARRAELYASLLQQAYEGDDSQFPDQLRASGVGALIGFKYDVTRDGDRIPVEEALRGLVRLESEERDRCARFCKLAVDAGISERAVRLAERQADLIVEVLTRAVLGAGLDEVARTRVLTVASEVLGQLGAAEVSA